MLTGQRNTYMPQSENGLLPPMYQLAQRSGSIGELNVNGGLTPNYGNGPTKKKNRRESSMLGIGAPGLVQQRKSSAPLYRDVNFAPRQAAVDVDEAEPPMAKTLW